MKNTKTNSSKKDVVKRASRSVSFDASTLEKQGRVSKERQRYISRVSSHALSSLSD